MKTIKRYEAACKKNDYAQLEKSISNQVSSAKNQRSKSNPSNINNNLNNNLSYDSDSTVNINFIK